MKPLSTRQQRALLTCFYVARNGVKRVNYDPRGRVQDVEFWEDAPHLPNDEYDIADFGRFSQRQWSKVDDRTFDSLKRRGLISDLGQLTLEGDELARALVAEASLEQME